MYDPDPDPNPVYTITFGPDNVPADTSGQQTASVPQSSSIEDPLDEALLNFATVVPDEQSYASAAEEIPTPIDDPLDEAVLKLSGIPEETKEDTSSAPESDPFDIF